MSNIAIRDGFEDRERDVTPPDAADRQALASFLLWAIEEAERMEEVRTREHLAWALLELTEREGLKATSGKH